MPAIAPSQQSVTAESYHRDIVVQAIDPPHSFDAGQRFLRSAATVREAFDLESSAVATDGKVDRYLLRVAEDQFQYALELAEGEPLVSSQAAFGLGRTQLRLGQRWRAIRSLRLARQFGEEVGSGYIYTKRADQLLHEVLSDQRIGRRICNVRHSVEL